MSSSYRSPGPAREIPRPSQQTLKDLSLYSAPFAAGSIITGDVPAFLVFTGIGVGAEALEAALYSDSKGLDYIENGVKQLDPTPPPYDFFTKEAIDKGFDYYKQSGQNPCP